MRVLLLMGHATGGIAGHVAGLLEGLPRHGIDTLLATSTASAARLPHSSAVQVAWPGRTGIPTRLRQMMARADVVHAHGHQAGSLAVAVRRLSSQPLLPSRRPLVVVTWHNAILDGGPTGRLGAAMELVQARGADLVTGASSDLVARAARLGARHPELSLVAAPDLQPWPGDRAVARAELADELDLPVDAWWVLTVSRIAPQKDLPVLVDAAHRLRRCGGRPVVWVVVGDGDPDLTAQLRHQIRSVDAPVRLVGVRRDVPRMMAAVDVLALPSRWEARSLVIQEAMTAGLPIVVTAVGGLPDLVGDTALLIPPEDSHALATAVRKVLDNPRLAADLGARARTRAAGLPDNDAVVTWWADRYFQLVG